MYIFLRKRLTQCITIAIFSYTVVLSLKNMWMLYSNKDLGPNYISSISKYSVNKHHTHFKNSRFTLFNNESILVAQRFKQRKELLNEMCNKVNATWPKSAKRLVYAAKYKLFGCLVAKNGATNLRFHFTKMNGIKLGDKWEVYEAKQIEANRYFPRPNVLWNTLKGSDTRTLLMARHPLTRLAACYRDKFNGGTLEKNVPQRKRTIFVEAEMTLQTYLGNDTHWIVNFTEFLRFVIKYQQIERNENSTNIHLLLAHSSCSLCHIKYDYICHKETYNEDLEFLFWKLGITETKVKNIWYRQYLQNNVSEDQDFSLYRNVSKSIFKQLIETVSLDMLFFGYQVPSFLQDKLY